MCSIQGEKKGKGGHLFLEEFPLGRVVVTSPQRIKNLPQWKCQNTASLNSAIKFRKSTQVLNTTNKITCRLKIAYHVLYNYSSMYPLNLLNDANKRFFSFIITFQKNVPNSTGRTHRLLYQRSFAVKKLNAILNFLSLLTLF